MCIKIKIEVLKLFSIDFSFSTANKKGEKDEIDSSGTSDISK